jgi:polyferredoxin
MRWIRPRTVFYAAILSIVGALMLAAVFMRTETDVNVIHNRSPLFVRLSSGDIRNSYQLKVLNKTHFDRTYRVSVEGLHPKAMTLLAGGDTPVRTFSVPANSVGEFRVQLVSADLIGGRTPVTFVLTDNTTGKVAKHASYFIRP